MNEIKDKFIMLPIEQRQNVEALCQAIRSAGFECWMVGGSVRDLALDKKPHDFDFASNVPLDEFSNLFKKVIPTGEEHGTVSVRVGGQFFEITRFRRDIVTDGRHATIEFAETIEEDLSRRDFTVNAIAFDPLIGSVIDPFNGLQDVIDKVLRFVGDARERILEDHLRALRFIRFQCGDDGLEADSADMIIVLDAFDANVLSQERINEEMGKIFERIEIERMPEVISMIIDMGVFDRFFLGKNGPDTVHCAVKDMISMKSLFPMAVHVARFNKSPKSITSLLKLPSEMKDHFILFDKMKDFDLFKRHKIKEFMNEIFKSEKDREKTIALFLELLDFRFQMGEIEDAEEYDHAKVLLEKIENNHEPFAISQLKINGNDLKELGFEGEVIGKILQFILQKVWLDAKLNSSSIVSNVKMFQAINEEFGSVQENRPDKSLNKSDKV